MLYLNYYYLFGGSMKTLKKYKLNSDTLAKILFVFSIGFFMFLYGYITHDYKLFLHTFIQDAVTGLTFFASYFTEDFYYRKTDYSLKVPTYNKNKAHNGLSLVTAVSENKYLSVKVIDMDGTLVHKWAIDWFEMWPEPTHIPPSDPMLPKFRPGTNLHGTELLNTGNLLFNFEYLGLVNLDICGNIVWRFPYKTHHSLYLDEYNNLWVSGRKTHTEPDSDYPNHIPPFEEPLIFKVSLDGELLKQISIFDVLKENDMQGLLLMSGMDKAVETEFARDTMHLNDVETFPSYMEEGVFKAGDIMVSLKNINTIFIFRESDLKITHISTGEFLRQHDPDFIDGNTISIFDNNESNSAENSQSRILIKSFADNETYVYYTGTMEQPFFTYAMGKHQWLPNGNLLITESMEGRAFEIDEQGNRVWEYINIVDEGYIGLLSEVYRLPNNYTKSFFEEKIKQCN